MWPDDFNFPNAEPEHPEADLAAFALNALDGPEHRAVAQHVAQCLHCQEVLLGFQGMAARLVESAPQTPLPPGLKARVLSAVTRPYDAPPAPTAPAAILPPPDRRWSTRRLRRWLAPAAIGALSLLLAASAVFMAIQQREINRLAAANMATAAAVATAAGSTNLDNPTLASASSDNAAASAALGPAAAVVGGPLFTATDQDADARSLDAANAEQVDLVRREMADVVEATVLSAQSETKKLAMFSPMGTEPEAKGVLMVDPGGHQGVLMVSGMPADSYQIWLARADKRMLVGRIVVNADDDGNGVQRLELDESVFDFQQVALLPDERNGPTVPSGEKFLTARIIGGPPLPSLNR